MASFETGRTQPKNTSINSKINFVIITLTRTFLLKISQRFLSIPHLESREWYMAISSGNIVHHHYIKQSCHENKSIWDSFTNQRYVSSPLEVPACQEMCVISGSVRNRGNLSPKFRWGNFHCFDIFLPPSSLRPKISFLFVAKQFLAKLNCQTVHQHRKIRRWKQQEWKTKSKLILFFEMPWQIVIGSRPLIHQPVFPSFKASLRPPKNPDRVVFTPCATIDIDSTSHGISRS